ncbi:MAG: hypothetical protein LBU32_11340 [Clostridiales bacterium]|jgi:hypothetical protein|nr:hypothetical protein [Clostridiales bacterium]
MSFFLQLTDDFVAATPFIFDEFPGAHDNACAYLDQVFDESKKLNADTSAQGEVLKRAPGSAEKSEALKDAWEKLACATGEIPLWTACISDRLHV